MNRVEIRYTESNILYHETIIFTLTLFLAKREIEKDAIRLIRPVYALWEEQRRTRSEQIPEMPYFHAHVT